MNVTFSFLHNSGEAFPHAIDVPMSAERARDIATGPIALWCRKEFGPLNRAWQYQKCGDTIRFRFLSEEAMERFVERWSNSSGDSAPASSTGASLDRSDPRA